jgi:hydrogenase large subunit
VTARVLARVVETARCLVALDGWIEKLEPGAPVYEPAGLRSSGRASGLVEAARGSLGHWATVEDGRISRYQIISPTTWNFSPRDAENRAGPLEAALAGIAADDQDGDAPVAVQHVVRSFDPCMVCTVH